MPAERLWDPRTAAAAPCSTQLLDEDVHDLSRLALPPDAAAVLPELAGADVRFLLTLPQVRRYSAAPNFPGSLCECSKLGEGAAQACRRFPSAALLSWM